MNFAQIDMRKNFVSIEDKLPSRDSIMHHMVLCVSKRTNSRLIADTTSNAYCYNFEKVVARYIFYILCI